MQLRVHLNTHWWCYVYLHIYITKNVGIHFLPVRYLRLTTALQVDEQSDTHVGCIVKYP